MRASLATARREHNVRSLGGMASASGVRATFGNSASAFTKPLADKGCVVEFVVDAASKMD